MTDELSSEPIELTVESRAHGWRIDHYLSRLYPNYSRVLFQKAIDQGAVLINGLEVKPSRRLKVNDCVSVRLPEVPDSSILPEEIPLDILHEDDSIVIINKSANMIVHPGKGNYRGTLASALQFHFDQLSDVAGKYRPGIVHRLDRDTTGVLVIAKNNQVHNNLSSQFENRSVKKQYRAIVWGDLEFDSDYIETHVRTHPKHREKMQVCSEGGNARHASTFYEVVERFRGFTYLRLFPKTGRTHQLRVHMQHIGHPIVADRVYGGRMGLRLLERLEETIRHEKEGEKDRNSAADPQNISAPANHLSAEIQATEERNETGESGILIQRQALHAFRLQFRHPKTDELLEFEAPLPNDFRRTLEALRTDRK